MPYRITVDEVIQGDRINADPVSIKRFEQTVDLLDMRKLIEAVNYKPRVPRTAKARVTT